MCIKRRYAAEITIQKIKMELEGLIIMNLGRTSGTSKAGNAWKKMNMCLRHQVLTRVRLSLRYSETAPTIYSLKTVKNMY